MSTRDAIRAIHAESRRVGWPTAFKKDLKHDATCIRRLHLTEFGWVLLRHGTHLLIPQQHPDWRAAVLRQGEEFGARFYWWDGKTLEQVSSDRLEHILDAKQTQKEE